METIEKTNVGGLNKIKSEPIYITKADGSREIFDSSKLEGSLKLAGASSQSVELILKDVSDFMVDGMTTHEIYSRAFEMLHLAEKPVALSYSLKRAVMELGPSGFPFEKFVAEVLREKGFETLTDQKVRGKLVEHEIDVVAWNAEKLIMVEAKFHNQLGVKTDLKVILYVKERFDDLSAVTFDYGKPGRKIDEGWLVTNTKFTSTAIEYGSQQGKELVMIGWNYPVHGNLHDMILQEKLHPLTCLATLKSGQKKLLLDRGVVLCKTLRDNPQLLEAVGLSAAEKEKTLEEIKSL
jgi:hypothetical protein